MDKFIKIEQLLCELEELVSDNAFEITDLKCRNLYNATRKELKEFRVYSGYPDEDCRMSIKKPDKLSILQDRFDKVCDRIETPEEFIQGIRDTMFPNGEDDW